MDSSNHNIIIQIKIQDGFPVDITTTVTPANQPCCSCGCNGCADNTIPLSLNDGNDVPLLANPPVSTTDDSVSQPPQVDPNGTSAQ